MKIIIAGGGVSGEELAKALISEKNEVVIIEADKKRAGELAEKLDCLVINENAANPRVLEDAGIRNADALIAMMGNDRDNILVALIARQLGLENIIVRIDDPIYNNILLYMGITKIINPSRLVTLQALSLLKGVDLLNVSTLFRGNIRLYTLKINEKYNGKKMEDLPISSSDAYPLLVFRDDEAFFPNKDLVLLTGDVILLAVKPDTFNRMIKEFES